MTEAQRNTIRQFEAMFPPECKPYGREITLAGKNLCITYAGPTYGILTIFPNGHLYIEEAYRDRDPR